MIVSIPGWTGAKSFELILTQALWFRPRLLLKR